MGSVDFTGHEDMYESLKEYVDGETPGRLQYLM